MITIISHFFLFLFLSFYNGKIFLDITKHDRLKLNFFEISLFGLIVTSFIAQIINFFCPLNDYLIIFNLFFVLVFFFQRKDKSILSLRKIDFINIFFLIFVILQIYGSGFSDDLDHYHYSYIKNTDTTNYIIGLGHLNHNFANSSIWLITHSYFNFNYSSLQDIHIVNALILYLFISIFFKEVKNIISKKKINIFIPSIFFILIFVLVKYTRLKEFGIDRPAFLIMFFFIFFFLKNFYGKNSENQINEKIVFLIYLSIFIFFIKITYFFIGIVPMYLIIKYKKFKIFKNLKFIPIYLLIFIYVLKNFLISGCLVYPIPSTCIDWISWNTKENAEKWYLLGEVLNKSWYKYDGILNELTYSKNFNWFKTWFYTTKNELLEFSLTTFLALVFTIFSFKQNSIRLTKYEKNYLNTCLKIFFLIFSISIFVFIFKLPVIRMAHYLFILISILIIMKWFSKFNLNANRFIIIIILLFSFTFNISKNLSRISNNNFENNPHKNIQAFKSSQTKHKLGDFIYYHGWYGDYPAGNTILDNSLFAHKKILIFNMIYKIN